MKKPKRYRVVGERKEVYVDDYTATSKEDAIRQFRNDIDQGVVWQDTGSIVIKAFERKEEEG